MNYLNFCAENPQINLLMKIVNFRKFKYFEKLAIQTEQVKNENATFLVIFQHCVVEVFLRP